MNNNTQVNTLTKSDAIKSITRYWASLHDWYNTDGDNGDGTYTIYTNDGSSFTTRKALRNWAGY